MSNGRRVVVVTAAAGIGLTIARRSPPTAIESLGKHQIDPGESRYRDTMPRRMRVINWATTHKASVRHPMERQRCH
jgi:hypothetical protein